MTPPHDCAPPDCALLLAIPLDKDTFCQDLAPSSPKQFAKNWQRDDREKLPLDTLWMTYEPYARVANSVADEAEALGVKVVRNARLHDFPSCSLEKKVITLVAHWHSFERGGAVEFADIPVPLQEVVQTIPAQFAATLDLTICDSILLGEEIRNKCADCAVMMNAEKTSLDFRFALYRQIIRSLARKPEPFIRVAMRLRNYFSKRFKCKD